MTTYNPTTHNTLVAAAASAVAGDTIDCSTNDITANPINTKLTIAPGVIITGSGTIAGYQWLFSGDSSHTSVVAGTDSSHRLTLNINGVNAYGGSSPIQLLDGTWTISDVVITGAPNSINTVEGNNLTMHGQTRVSLLTLNRCEVYGATRDCVSAKGNAGTYRSKIILNDCLVHNCGSGSFDNLVTSHDGTDIEVNRGMLYNAGATGPFANYDDAGGGLSNISLNNVVIDASASASGNANITSMIGCIYKGPVVRIQGTTGQGVCRGNVILTISGNTGVRHDSGDALISDNSIVMIGTSSSTIAGMLVNASCTVERCNITGWSLGNGIQVAADVTIRDCRLENNYQHIYATAGVATVTNVFFSGGNNIGRTAVTGTINIRNSICPFPMPKMFRVDAGTITSDYNTVAGTVGDISLGANDINAVPQMLANGMPHPTGNASAGDAAVTGIGTYDLKGNPRIVGGSINRGAVQYCTDSQKTAASNQLATDQAEVNGNTGDILAGKIVLTGSQAGTAPSEGGVSAALSTGSFLKA